MEDDELLSCVCVFNMLVIAGRQDGCLSVRITAYELINTHSFYSHNARRFGIVRQASGWRFARQAMTGL